MFNGGYNGMLCNYLVFEHYKDLEKGKWVKIESWFGPDQAKQEILNGIQRFNEAEVKPRF